MRLLGIALLSGAVAVLAAAPARDGAPPEAQAAMARLPLHFEANQGQWNPAVRYQAHTPEYNVLFTQAGPSFTFGEGKRVDLGFEGGNPAAEIEGGAPVALKTSYYLGDRKNWRIGVPNYAGVSYRAVYPGIDVAYYGSGSRLEYDFLVAPGADPSSIRMRFHGADRAAIDAQGDLTVECAQGRLTEKQPYIYQEVRGRRKRIEGGYVALAGGAFGLRLGAYDHSKPLVIDPYLIYSSFWGGAAADVVKSVKIAPNGLLYVLGKTATSDLVASATAYQGSNAAIGANDLFLMVLDTTNNFALNYLSYLGGTGDDQPAAMDVDAAGNMYITGSTTSSNFPLISATALQSTAPSSTDSVFVSEFNPSNSSVLQLVYSTYLGGSLTNLGSDIKVDAAGNIYVIGSTNSTDFPITDGAYSGILSGLQNAFLVEINPTLTTSVYSTYLGGEGTDAGNAIAVSSSGLVYFAVTTNSKEFPLSISPYRATLPGLENIVVGVIDPTQFGPNSLLFDTYYGGSQVDEARKVAFDASGHLMLTGYTLSPDFPVTSNAVQSMPGGNGDVFVSVLDPAHPQSFVVYSSYLGGSQGEVAYAVAGDVAGNIYLAGYTLSPDFPTTSDAPQTAWGGGIDVFVAKLMPGVSGRSGLAFSTYLGGLGINVAYSFSLATNGTVYVGGYGDLGIPAVGARANQYGGGSSDGIIFALAQLAGQSAGSNRRDTPRPPRY